MHSMNSTLLWARLIERRLIDPDVEHYSGVRNRFWREYGAAFDLISEDNSVRVVVLSSALEKTFSAGVDRA